MAQPTIQEITNAIWANDTRTLITGSPLIPSNLLEEICNECWSYDNRTLLTAPEIIETTSIIPYWDTVEERYTDDWQLNTESSLWNECHLFLGGQGGGTTAIDSSPFRNHGIINDVTWRSGLGRRHWVFDVDNNASIDVPGVFAPPTSNGGYFTMHCWARRGVVDEGGPNVLITMGGKSNGAALYYRSTPDTVHFDVSKSVDELDSTSTFAEGSEWFAITGVCDDTAMRLYVDGVLEASGTRTTGWNKPTVGTGIGNDDNVSGEPFFSGTPWEGDIADVGIWFRVLSPAEIRQLASRRPDLDGAITPSTTRYFPITVPVEPEEEEETSTSFIPYWDTVDGVYDDDWELSREGAIVPPVWMMHGALSSETSLLDATHRFPVFSGDNSEYITKKTLGNRIGYEFTDDANYVLPTYIATLIATSGTLACWYYHDGDITTERFLFDSRMSGSGGWEIGVSSAFSANHIGGLIDTGGDTIVEHNITNTPVGWHHIALTYDGSFVRFYFDGVLRDSNTASGSSVGTADPIRLGNQFNRTKSLGSGRALSDFAIWDV